VTVSVPIVTPLTPPAAGTEATASAPPAVPAVRRLTAAMANGDEEAFREFHAAYFHRLLRYLFVVMRGDEDAARDALQETFTRAARHAHAFDSEEAFWSWLTLLARNAAADGYRKRQRYGALLSRFALSWKTRQEPEPPIEEEHLDRLLTEATSTLEPIERSLIEEKYFRRASVRDLAAKFQLSEKAVESRLARARRQLRAELTKRLKNEDAH
jgi:RNA polymerase sigma factor (sigma-70 family)